MDYVCDYMKKIVVYDQCIGCYRSKAEMPVHSCTAIEELGKLLAQPGFEAAKVIIEGLRK